MDGAHTARFAQETLATSSTRGCLVQWTRSGEEKASRKSCWSYGAEYVGKIQYSFSKMRASGSAYQPGKRGLPEGSGAGTVVRAKARRAKGVGRIAAAARVWRRKSRRERGIERFRRLLVGFSDSHASCGTTVNSTAVGTSSSDVTVASK